MTSLSRFRAHRRTCVGLLSIGACLSIACDDDATGAAADLDSSAAALFADADPGDVSPGDSSPPEAAAEVTSPPDSGPSEVSAGWPDLPRIFVNLGPRETCWRYDISGCDIVALDFDPVSGAVRKAETLARESGAEGTAALSLSPDGTRLAYDALSGAHLTTHVRDLVSGAVVTMAPGSNKASWLDDETVAFGVRNESLRTDESSRWSDIGKQRVPDTRGMTGTTANPNPVTRVLGAVNSETGFETYDCGGEDPWPVPGRPGWIAFHGSVWRFAEPTTPTVAHTCPWLVGLNPYTDKKDPRAVVFDTNATSWSEGTTWERVMPDTAGITGCAHASVAPSGNRLLCTNQPEVTTMIDPVDGATTRFNDMYGFDRDGTTWRATRPDKTLFDHLTPRSLPDVASLWAPGTSCHVYRTKQGSFCGSDTLIATDVYCEDTSINPADPKQVFARAYLIDITHPEAPRYLDLTSAVEDARGLGRGELGAYTLTCGGAQTAPE